MRWKLGNPGTRRGTMGTKRTGACRREGLLGRVSVLLAAADVEASPLGLPPWGLPPLGLPPLGLPPLGLRPATWWQQAHVVWQGLSQSCFSCVSSRQVRVALQAHCAQGPPALQTMVEAVDQSSAQQQTRQLPPRFPATQSLQPSPPEHACVILPWARLAELARWCHRCGH